LRPLISLQALPKLHKLNPFAWCVPLSGSGSL
jgi:hypothetical protein